MDEIRRGAMTKMGRYAVGAVGLAGTLGRGNVATAGQKGVFDSSNSPVVGDYLAKAKYAEAPTPPSPLEMARYRAVEPLREKIGELEGWNNFRTSQYMGQEQQSTYLTALRSTAPHWRASVLMDKRKQQQSAIATLQEQINKMLRSPLDALEETAREAIQGFLAEMQKP